MTELLAQLRAMARDESLSPRDLHIWLEVSEQLVATEARPLRIADVAALIRMSAPIVVAALKRLSDAGYLVRDGVGVRGVVCYRLPEPAAPPPLTSSALAAPVLPRRARSVVGGWM
ncbi:MAG: hypothetical protein JWO05_1157 [Gemmatimonadetes bacterium]|nr:hypothetical protein [Gemmatimonadota bacterium]